MRFSFIKLVGMKKILAIALLLIYTMSAFGISARYHYCMDNLTKINIGFGSGHDCKCNVPIETNGCCKDKVFNLKTDTHSTSPLVSSELSDSWTAVPVFFNSYVFAEPEIVFSEMGNEHGQSISPHSIFLLNQNFRI